MPAAKAKTTGDRAWPRRWRGRWIWWTVNAKTVGLFNNGPDRPADAIGFLRRTIFLDKAPASARCRLTVDGRYILWVNGTRVGRGPVRSEPAFLTYDEYDIAAHLGAGENVIAIQARHYGGSTIYWKPAPPVGDLGYGSFVFEAEIDGTVVVSDTEWNVRPAPYERPDKAMWIGVPPREIVDGREWPFGWASAGFDDSSWAAAVHVDPSGIATTHREPPTEPFGVLGPRPIGALAERIVEPVSSTVHGDTTVYDFGGIVNSHPILAVDAPAGTLFEMTCGEDLDADGMVVSAPRRWVMTYTAAGRAGESIEAFEPVGFRWLSVTSPAGAAAVTLSALERTYPRPAGTSFACSDAALTELWAVGARTLDLCSTDAFLDCPGREQRAWLGDAYVHTLLTYVTNPDRGLATWNVRLHGQGARNDGLLPMVGSGDLTDLAATIPDYSLHWVRTIARVWDHTADADLVLELLPTCARALDWFERHRADDGLLRELTSWIFVDWAQNERGVAMAAIDALYALTLDDFATLCDVAGDAGSAARARARAAETRRAFEQYYDAGRGIYVDAIGVGPDGIGGPGRRVSQQVNTLAILAGCAPKERWAALLAYVFDESRLKITRTPATPGAPAEKRLFHQWLSPEHFDEETDVVVAQPFFAHLVHQAVAVAGEYHRLPDLMRRWQALVDRGNNAIEEYWDAPPGEGSRCHAWSCTPTYDMTTHVLGVRPGAPGWTSVIVDPHLGDLEWAEGSVPTPFGYVHVRVAAGADAKIELPEGVTLVDASL